ncbi:MAG TPA: ATP-binding cassette domain-containing protein [Egibacteraceae bacterium]|nr:ATP-binding cassette domain-containing protein [Egibacteraceae bacterium]
MVGEVIDEPVGGDGTIVMDGLTKRFGAVTAVQDFTCTVHPGRVTGFLGPNGAGKTTTLRMLLGLVQPDSGRARIGGRAYEELNEPLRVVGAGLDGSSFHPGRSGRDHLRWVAATHGIDDARVDALLALTGLTDAAYRRVGGYSSGMRQRLALAGALLGDPAVLLLDEPANGLDPEGIAWLRGFLRALAAEGRTVLVSSHVLSEVQQSVDDILVIARGRLVLSGPLSTLGEPGVDVAATDLTALRSALTAANLAYTDGPNGRLLVTTRDPGEVGAVAHAAGLPLLHLAPIANDLEQAFLRLVATAEQARR